MYQQSIKQGKQAPPPLPPAMSRGATTKMPKNGYGSEANSSNFQLQSHQMSDFLKNYWSEMVNTKKYRARRELLDEINDAHKRGKMKKLTSSGESASLVHEGLDCDDQENSFVDGTFDANSKLKMHNEVQEVTKLPKGTQLSNSY